MIEQNESTTSLWWKVRCMDARGRAGKAYASFSPTANFVLSFIYPLSCQSNSYFLCLYLDMSFDRRYWESGVMFPLWLRQAGPTDIYWHSVDVNVFYVYTSLFGWSITHCPFPIPARAHVRWKAFLPEKNAAGAHRRKREIDGRERERERESNNNVSKRATGRLPDLSMDDVITNDGTRRCCMSGDTRGDTSVSLRMPRSLGDNQLLPALSDDPVPAADLTAAVGEPLPTCVNIDINNTCT